jgi:poly(A) polymerase
LPEKSDPLELLRTALAGQRAWLVGGAVRDRALRSVAPGDRSHVPGGPSPGVEPSGGRSLGGALTGSPREGAADLDVVIDGDPREAARLIARASMAPRASAFALSDDYGGWRVVARGGAWQIDVERLRGRSLAEDLALRDFTVNAMAEPLLGAGLEQRELIDPLGGLEDLAHRRLRAVAPRAFAEDPLRVLRLVRMAVELGLEPTPETQREAAAQAAALRSVSPERIFMELRRILASTRASDGLELMREVGALRVVLPELEATRGVQQSRYHHRDVYGHTLEVLDQTIALTSTWGAGADAPPRLQGPPAAVPDARLQEPLDRDLTAPLRAPLAAELAALLDEPLADGLTRGEALRWGALLHDVAKPLTREVQPDPGRAAGGRVTFIGHDRRGAELTEAMLGRLRASGRLRSHVAALVRHHLRLGFLVHQPQPLARRTVFAYLRACGPVEVDVTLLSIADRLATRGERSQEAIDAHLRLARELLADALRWRSAGGPPAALWRGDELARELDIPLGPRVGELLEELAAARYAEEILTREQALAHARRRCERASSG